MLTQRIAAKAGTVPNRPINVSAYTLVFEGQRDTGAKCSTIGPDAFQQKRNPVIAILDHISQQGGCRVQVVDHNVDVAIVSYGLGSDGEVDVRSTFEGPLAGQVVVHQRGRRNKPPRKQPLPCFTLAR